MYDRSLTIEQNLSLLVATPSRTADLIEDLPAVQLLTALHPGEWSARGVLAHLRAFADIWGKCIAQILSQDRSTIRLSIPPPGSKDHLSRKGISPLAEAFTVQRAELLAVLKPLAPEALSRMAMVTGAGKPRERTVHTYAQWLANHERSYIKQIERIVNILRS